MFLSVLFLSVASKFCGPYHYQIQLTSKSSGSGSNDTKSLEADFTKLLEDTFEPIINTYGFILQLLADKFSGLLK